jgi:hypothetical protein
LQQSQVERAFRSVKEAYETLYHFHQPETEQQANAWLNRYLIHDYNQPHGRLVSQSSTRGRSRHVRMGAILPLRPRAGTTQSGRRRAPER